MTAFPGRLPSLRLPRLAAGGSAHVHAALGIATVFVLLLAVYWFAQRPTLPASTVTRTPALDPKPGDANNSDYLRGLAIDKAHRDAEAARATGQVTTPNMRAAGSQPDVQPPAAVKPQDPPQGLDRSHNQPRRRRGRGHHVPGPG